MKLLLAGPGTGKTSRIKQVIREEFANANRILVLSFTNSTVNDLTDSFKNWNNVECYTLHSYALRINHLVDHHILDTYWELPKIKKYAKSIDVEYSELGYLLKYLTFDDMISKCVEFLTNNPVYSEKNIGQLDLLIVDEFQDFNASEKDLVYLISTHSSDTFILGDDDQSIYGFKDADPNGIIKLYQDKNIELIQNENICYRCPDEVVDHAIKLIRKNKNRVDKPLIKSGKEGQIIFKQFMSQKQTNDFICSEVTNIQEQNNKSTILVLSPVGYYIDNLKDKFKEANIEYEDFWNAKIDLEMLRKIWWLRAIFTDKKVLNLVFLHYDLTPYNRRKFEKLTMEIIKNNFSNEIFAKNVSSLFPAPFNEYISKSPTIQNFLSKNDTFSDFLSLANSLNIDQSLESMVMDHRPKVEFNNEAVNLMSIHKSKGLQADHVFVTGLVEGILPNKIRGLDSIEAQRRLLYVGMTRALKYLYMISPIEWEGKYVNKLDKSQFKYDYRKKKYNGRTSVFISEMR